VPVSELHLATARAALREFGLPADARIDFVAHRENHVFRVRADGVDLALRLHRPGYRSDEELRAEVAAMAAFRAAGIAVPDPLPTPAGEDVAVVVDADGTRRQATALGWFDAAAPMSDSGEVLLGRARPARIRELGVLAGRLHTVAERIGSALAADRPVWDAAGLVGPASLWGSATGSVSLDAHGRAVLAEAESRLGAVLGALPRDRHRFGCIHADLTFENVLEHAGGLAVIDFDDSGPGWYLFDLATTAFWCAGHPEGQALVGELFDGYLEHRTLDDTDRAAWEPLLLARALSYLGWSAARPGDPVSEFHEAELVPRVVAAAERFLDTGGTGWPGPPPAGRMGP